MPEQKKLSQNEIDDLLVSLQSFDPIDISPLEKSAASREVLDKYKTVNYANKRLDWARENQSYDEVREARRNLKEAAFDLWLANHKMTRYEFKNMIEREKKKKLRK